MEELKIANYKKEIYYLIASLFVIVTLAISFKVYTVYKFQSLNEINTKIYEHPLKVLHAVLNTQMIVEKLIHNLENIAQNINNNTTKKTFESTIKKIEKSEINISKNLNIMKNNILDEKVKEHYKSVILNYEKIQSLKTNVIVLLKNNELQKAAKLVDGKSRIYDFKANKSLEILYNYIRNKVSNLRKSADNLYSKSLFIMIVMGIVIVCLFLAISIYIVLRIRKYILNYDKLHEKLLQQKNELDLIIEEAPNPIMIHNENGEVLRVNKIWEELTGYKYAEINTLDKWTKNAYGEHQKQVKNRITDLYSITKKVDSGEFHLQTKDDKDVIWSFTAAPLGIIDGKKTIISAAMDITDMKMKDNLLVIQSRYAAVGEMLSMIAHQWRQPLSVISMSVNNVLVDIELDEFKQEELIKNSHTILNQTEYLSNTIEDFKNFFIKDDKAKEFSIQEILQDTMKVTSASLKSHFISLETIIQSDIKLVLNKRKLVQVLINLITNAKDALVMNTNVKDKKIQIQAIDENETVKIIVSDNGGGVDESIMEKIFDPYFSTKKSLNGTGLGLYMSKTIITQHLGGAISVSNTEEGASFIIELKKTNEKNNV